MQEEAAADKARLRQLPQTGKGKRAQLTEWLLRELPESQERTRTEATFTDAGCFISTGSGRSAERLQEGKKKHRKYVRWNMRNWKKMTERQKRLGKQKRPLQRNRHSLAGQEGTKRALEEQLKRNCGGAKTTAFMEKRILRKERVRGGEDRNSLADQIAQVISFRKTDRNSVRRDCCHAGKVSRRAEMYRTAEKAEAGSGKRIMAAAGEVEPS